MIRSASKEITLYKNWLPYQKGTIPFIDPNNLCTVCALWVGDISGRTPTSLNFEFFQASVANVLTVDDQKMKQIERNPDTFSPWVDTLFESDNTYVSYIEYLMALVQQKVFAGQYDELPSVVRETFQCQDWLKISQSK